MAKAAAKTTPKEATPSTRGRRVEIVGEVVGDKMHKTISVQIYRMIRHKKYGKIMRRSSVHKAHDENNTAKVGDIVRIVHTRPLSKTKRWALAEIVQKGKRAEAVV